MNFLPAVMLSIAATSDSFVIGFNFGVKRVRIGFFSNLYIALVCFAGTWLSMLAGRHMGGAVSPGFTSLLSGILLLGLGLWMLITALRKNKTSLHGVCADPDCVDKDHSKIVELRESIMIGLLLSLNNMGLGVGAGMAGLPVAFTSALCGLASFVFVKAGCAMGKRLSLGGLGRVLELASALLVAVLGVFELLS